MRAITDRPVLIRPGGIRYGDRRYHYRAISPYGADQPEVIVNEVNFHRYRFQQLMLQSAHRPEVQARHREKYAFVDFDGLMKVAEALDAQGCISLFEQAFAIDVLQNEDFFILFSGSEVLIVHHTRLCRVRGGLIAQEGFLNRRIVNARSENRLERIASLDEVEVTRL